MKETEDVKKTGLDALISACENAQGAAIEPQLEGENPSPVKEVTASTEKGQTKKYFVYMPFHVVEEEGKPTTFMPIIGSYPMEAPPGAFFPAGAKMVEGDEEALYNNPPKQKWTKFEESLLWGILVNRIAFSGSWIISQNLKKQEEKDTSAIFWDNIATVFNPLRARFIPNVNGEPRTSMSLKRKLQKLREDNKEKDYIVLPDLSRKFFNNQEVVDTCYKPKLYTDDVHKLTEEEVTAIFDEPVSLEQQFQKPTRNTGYTMLEEVLLVHCVFSRLLTKGSLFPKRKDEIANKHAVFGGISEQFEKLRALLRDIDPNYLRKERLASALQRRWKTLKGTPRVPFLFKKSMELNFEDRESLKKSLAEYE